jgi:hypothetical protein
MLRALVARLQENTIAIAIDGVRGDEVRPPSCARVAPDFEAELDEFRLVSLTTPSLDECEKRQHEPQRSTAARHESRRWGPQLSDRRLAV